MKISLGYSPCPNDTFIFDALVHGRIDCEGLEFDVHLGDVEELNRLAFAGKLDMTKLSYHAFAYLTDAYRLLPAGSALGHNCGPLLIAREPLDAASLSDAPVAIPGRYTTANFLLSLAYPHLRNKQEVLFSDIESGVASGRYRAGLIIHENRFTYADHGLVKLRDLGEYWEETTGFPIPLGGIVLRRTFPKTFTGASPAFWLVRLPTPAPTRPYPCPTSAPTRRKWTMPSCRPTSVSTSTNLPRTSVLSVVPPSSTFLSGHAKRAWCRRGAGCFRGFGEGYCFWTFERTLPQMSYFGLIRKF